MTPQAAWRLLGIAATQDRKAIRSAYAARLRAIDPDADRDGFAALRTARDLALALVAQTDVTVAEEDASRPDGVDGVTVTLPAPALPLTAPVVAIGQGEAAEFSLPAPVSQDEWQAPLLTQDYRAPGDADDAIDLAIPDWTSAPPHEVEAFDADRPDHALHALLYPDPDADTQQAAMTQADMDAGAALIDRLHADAQQGAIDLHDRTENWLANVLAGAWPRSHPLLAHAAGRFGWAAREGQIDAPPAIDYINRRLASERFADAVQEKGHPLHGAWKQLSKPTRAGQSRAIWWEGHKIDDLLATIRRDYPELEQRLDWHRVAMWDSRRDTPRSTKGAIFMVVVAIQLIAVVARCVGDKAPDQDSYAPLTTQSVTPATQPLPVSVPPRRPGGLGDFDADVKAALLAAFGPDMTVKTLKNDAQLVYQMFESNWRISLDMDRTRAQYIATMEGLMRERYGLLARQAGGAALVAYQRQRLREERLLKDEHWKHCAESSNSGRLPDIVHIPADKRAKARASIAKLILAMPANPAPPPSGGTFSVPGPIVEKTMAGSGLPLDRVQATFQGQGSDREKCLSHIALLDATLEANAETQSAILPHI
ncbi:hypothetical protein Q4610_01430 [Sphingobium sp. HBC34]|uniref:Molecular chaperone DnaJ n=1 Tax=Sphingobium cyanobacteriorum TaxID=3063954 RepID=A0ABT8ZIT4_9SPHN|nr:hypothetical protein [Sphingobium sp. HBC34]MDO7833695.1 hypothetical protein [Sphingobium sp. HBC34]